MLTSEFDYSLPEELIAQFPPKNREESRMLVVDRADNSVRPDMFKNICSHLAPGDCAVLNDTKVMRARFHGKKESGASIEILLTDRTSGGGNRWRCLLKPAKRLSVGSRIILTPNMDGVPEERATLAAKHEDGSCEVVFDSSDMESLQEAFGHIPLPPYIKRGDKADDIARYQTVYAKNPGAVAAPTAGLHFTDAILDEIAGRGVSVRKITLHVGPGTFKPVSAEKVADHKMHFESFEVPEETAAAVNDCRRNGGRVLAVGTTVVRALESMSDGMGVVRPGEGRTDIFIHPPYKPRSFDMLLTNFHLPKSTLLMLVCAFAGKDLVMRAYETAVRERMRFYSYGDCMLIK